MTNYLCHAQIDAAQNETVSAAEVCRGKDPELSSVKSCTWKGAAYLVRLFGPDLLFMLAVLHLY